MPEPFGILVVASSFRLPGLGVLVLPTEPVPAWLATCALHTAVAVTLLAQGHSPTALTGTAEELTHDGQPPRRALLLDFDPGGPLPSGARLQIEAILPSLL
jgi:hypothetical protein